MTSTAVVWFRRDLRVGDQPTFLAAADAADRALALFVLDPALLGRPAPRGGTSCTAARAGSTPLSAGRC